MRNFLVSAAALLLSACVTTAPSSNVHQPMSARPPVQAPAAYNDGAIYRAGQDERPLFEDRRARNVGDIITISIVEKTTANDTSTASASHGGALDLSTPSITLNSATPKLLFTGMSATSSSSGSYSQQSAGAGAVDFTGTITATVIEVLQNGNLLVSGEKQVAVNRNNEYIRFSGVVNPATIGAGNTVPSTQVADARLEYKGRSGTLDTAAMADVMGRLFLSILPF